MPFAYHDHMIQQIPTDRSDDALDVTILPRRSWSNGTIADPVGPEYSCGFPEVVVMQSMDCGELDYLTLFGWMDRSANR